MKFEDLMVDHPYYCSDNNYYSRDAAQSHEKWSDFYDEYKDADEDMNLIFRFDVKKWEEDSDEHSERPFKAGDLYVEIFMMQQRKGIFRPHMIYNIKESDFEEIKEILQRHYNRLQEMWRPFSNKGEKI
jgi:hypothetical protein